MLIPTAAKNNGRQLRKCVYTTKPSSNLDVTLILGDRMVSVLRRMVNGTMSRQAAGCSCSKKQIHVPVTLMAYNEV